MKDGVRFDDPADLFSRDAQAVTGDAIVDVVGKIGERRVALDFGSHLPQMLHLLDAFFIDQEFVKDSLVDGTEGDGWPADVEEKLRNLEVFADREFPVMFRSLTKSNSLLRGVC